MLHSRVRHAVTPRAAQKRESTHKRLAAVLNRPAADFHHEGRHPRPALSAPAPRHQGRRRARRSSSRPRSPPRFLRGTSRAKGPHPLRPQRPPQGRRAGDDTRIRASVPTVKYLDKGLRSRGVAPGRPKDGPEDSLCSAPWPRAWRAARHGREDGTRLHRRRGRVDRRRLGDGEALLLENTRFYKEETKNDAAFVEKLAALGPLRQRRVRHGPPPHAPRRVTKYLSPPSRATSSRSSSTSPAPSTSPSSRSPPSSAAPSLSNHGPRVPHPVRQGHRRRRHDLHPPQGPGQGRRTSGRG